MNISVFGTGEVGTAVASKLKSLGHDTVFGSRHPGRDRDGIPVLSHADAAAHPLPPCHSGAGRNPS